MSEATHITAVGALALCEDQMQTSSHKFLVTTVLPYCNVGPAALSNLVQTASGRSSMFDAAL